MAFVVISNQGVRELSNLLFNDGYLGFFIILTIYCIFKQRYNQALLAMNLAIGTKAGALLLVPAFLVTMLLGKSFKGVLLSIVFTVVFQYVMAYQFISSDLDSYMLDSRLFGHSG